MPLMTPTGIAKAAPNPIRISVPTIAFAMPPPDSPTGAGMLKKKARFSERMPCVMTRNRIRASGTSAIRTANAHRLVITFEMIRRTASFFMRRPPGAQRRQAAPCEQSPYRFILQMRTRDPALTNNVMTNSTSPTSMSASR